MRVLWVDADGNPFTDSNGWRVLEDFGLHVRRITSVAEAQREIARREFELVLVRAEMPGAPSLLIQCHKLFAHEERKVVLASSEWSKEQFRVHSKTDGAAHRYARVPMPPDGFLNLVADLFGCGVDELADFDLPNPTEAPIPKPSSPSARRKKTAPGEEGDIDVLRKYLAIREEQLAIAEGEREELGRENDRLQREAHDLQLTLRELRHAQDELTKKIEHMEEERAESERQAKEDHEVAERVAKISHERIRNLEEQLNESGEKYEALRARVRKDIRKIRENERDLEARLELTRKDSETLLSARDNNVLELQRKIDALEFDLDQVQDGRVQAQMEAERYLVKLSRVSRALQIATSMIEDDRAGEAELAELEPLAGGAANAEDPEPEMPETRAMEPAAPENSPTDAPPAEEAAAPVISDELAALANEGEATQMISVDNLPNAGGDSGTSSG